MNKDALKALIPKVNRLTERVGVRLQPVHYYSEVPDRRWLAAHRGQWSRPMLPAEIPWDLSAQLAWLEKICGPHLDEVPPYSEWDRGLGFGPGYGPVEAQVLRCFVRAMAPPRIVEVGSGMSTTVAVTARDRNRKEGGPRTEITCIEPYPTSALRALDVKILEIGLQAASLDTFASLGPGDLLFIDSTHTVHTGSDVIRLYLEILPNLAAGVTIHIHDIYFPYLYSPFILEDIFDWQESALLAALLTGNRHLRILSCLSALCHLRPEEMRRILPDMRPARYPDGLGAPDGSHFPTSLWLETV